MRQPTPSALIKQRCYPNIDARALLRWLVIPTMLLAAPLVSADAMGRFGFLLNAVETARSAETGNEEGPGDDTPVVSATPAYEVLLDSDVVYAYGLSRDNSSPSAVEQPQLLDIYQPDNDVENRPVFMFIHGAASRAVPKPNHKLSKWPITSPPGAGFLYLLITGRLATWAQ